MLTPRVPPFSDAAFGCELCGRTHSTVARRHTAVLERTMSTSVNAVFVRSTVCTSGHIVVKWVSVLALQQIGLWVSQPPLKDSVRCGC